MNTHLIRGCLRALCIVLVCASSGLARADAAYDEAVTQGLVELEANHYPEAREEFRRAHALFPNARTLRGLGMVEFELRNYRECARLLEEALASRTKPLDDKLRAETEALLDRARRYLGELSLRTDPPAATVIVDGTRVERGADDMLLLDVGEHVLEVQAPGHASDKRVVRVRGGERTELRVSLAPLGPRQSTGDTHADARPSTPVYKKWWLWTTVALVAVAGATTAAVLIARDRETDTTAANTGNADVSLHTLRSF